jgi:hypothetical protein
MRSLAKNPLPQAEHPSQVTVIVNGKPVSVTIVEGTDVDGGIAAGSPRAHEPDHPADAAADYLPKP